jgi:hypothetical protein
LKKKFINFIKSKSHLHNNINNNIDILLERDYNSKNEISEVKKIFEKYLPPYPRAFTAFTHSHFLWEEKKLN